MVLTAFGWGPGAQSVAPPSAPSIRLAKRPDTKAMPFITCIEIRPTHSPTIETMGMFVYLNAIDVVSMKQNRSEEYDFPTYQNFYHIQLTCPDVSALPNHT